MKSAPFGAFFGFSAISYDLQISPGLWIEALLELLPRLSVGKRLPTSLQSGRKPDSRPQREKAPKNNFII